MNTGLVILLIIVLILVCQNTETQEQYDGFVATDSHGGKYEVHLDLPVPQVAVAKLSKLNAFIVRVIEGMRKRYAHRDDMPIHQGVAKRLDDDYRPGELFEQKPNDGSITSFVTNKGEKVTFCLRNISNYDVHNDGILKFVALHEISHIGTKDIGHHHEFWRNFRIVLESAILDGYFQPVNYTIRPTDYCGKTINYTPLVDTRLDYVSVLSHDRLNKML